MNLLCEKGADPCDARWTRHQSSYCSPKGTLHKLKSESRGCINRKGYALTKRAAGLIDQDTSDRRQTLSRAEPPRWSIT